MATRPPGRTRSAASGYPAVSGRPCPRLEEFEGRISEFRYLTRLRYQVPVFRMHRNPKFLLLGKQHADIRESACFFIKPLDDIDDPIDVAAHHVFGAGDGCRILTDILETQVNASKPASLRIVASQH